MLHAAYRCSQFITNLPSFQSLYLFLVSKQTETNGNALANVKYTNYWKKTLTGTGQWLTGATESVANIQRDSETWSLGVDWNVLSSTWRHSNQRSQQLPAKSIIAYSRTSERKKNMITQPQESLRQEVKPVTHT